MAESLMQMYETMTATAQQELYDFKPIIENIVYDGLNYQLEKIENKHGGEKHEYFGCG